MSIFPRHVLPGSSLTLHKRWLQLSLAGDVKIASSDVRIRAPGGRSWWAARTDVDQLPLAAGAGNATLHHLAMSSDIHALIQPALDRIVRRLEGGEALRQAARQVIEEALRHRPIDDLLEQMLVMRASQHRYHTIPVPEDAELGRYEVEISLRRDGPMTLPPARTHGDWFCVERLRLRALSAERAVVDNESPAPCEAILHRLDHRDGWAHLADRRPIRFEPRSTTVVPREPGSTLLTYAEGAGRMLLVEQDSVPRRSEWVRWSRAGDGVTLRLVEGASLPPPPEEGVMGRLARGETAVLTGEEAQVWLEADGYRLASIPAIAEKLVADGLLIPTPARHPR